MTAGPQAVPRCYRHPNREAHVRCTRCDRPICPECMRDAPVGFHCPDDTEIGARSVRRTRTVAGAPVRAGGPLVTYALVVLNVGVYVATVATGGHGIDRPEASNLFEKWQLIPQAVVLQDSYYRMLTAAFLHVNLAHVLVNMLSLVFIGPAVEAMLGRLRFTAVYLLAALSASAAVFVFGARYGAVAGASGAIYGLFAVLLLLARELRLDRQWVLSVVILNVAVSVVLPVSLLGHGGGFVGGGAAGIALLGLPGVRRVRPSPRVQAAGLAGILFVLVAAVAWRAATL